MCRLASELPQQHLQAAQTCSKALEVMHQTGLQFYATATDEFKCTQMAVHLYWLVLQAHRSIACCDVALMQLTCTASTS